ncbi:isochorismatase family protein [Pseudarthrobacter oxydans]|uniref:isochorismatase family protein n=1 Tax=Pseudarthrobacter oxydans TaxID=1671 RepID=UPI00381510D1
MDPKDPVQITGPWKAANGSSWTNAWGANPTRCCWSRSASCFFGADLIARLQAKRVDRVIIVGCTTSGCVRATAVDACSYGIPHHYGPRGGGGPGEAPHLTSLFDIDAKYGDVVDVQEADGYLKELSSTR